MGLDNEKFGTMRSNVLGSDDLPSLTKIYHMVTQEEHHQNLTRGRDEKGEVVAFAARTVNNGGEKEEKRKCSFCQRTGHEVENCFRRTGKYPEWWFENPARGRGGRNREGGAGGRGRATAHAVQTGHFEPETVSQFEEKSGVGHNPGFTDEQWQQVMKLLEQCKPVSTE
ncbi:unnamed protein product [Cuscuta europaea]|uniref:Uncharacterized protein n=1 Tax=Cuscuta europaea TaxID=41803 RepID=A0A9P0Z9R5_CUSEU|nr:unnamed protein product [Cuscuta europaea]